MIRLLTFSTLFPNEQQPNHGVFVENRLQHLLAYEPSIESRVVAPVPWFPVASKRFGDYGKFAAVPSRETRDTLSVDHPRYVVIPKLGMPITPATLYLGSLPVLRRLQREQDFDLIDAHYFYPDGVAAVWLGKALGKPVVITARGTDINLVPQHILPRRMIQKAAAEADGIVAVSQALKDAMLELGIAGGSVTVLRNGVDLTLFHPEGRDAARQKLGVSSKVLLSVGLLIERKGHHFIIEAMQQLTGYSLLIAGEGPELQNLEKLADRLGVGERVRFLGAVPHRDLQAIYAAADALVLASSREGWPNVLLESMACGTPVIATNVWGNPEVVSEPAAGTLAMERSAQGIAEGVQRLFAKLPDRRDTRSYAEQFSWNATSEGQRTLFNRILAQRGRRGG